MSSETTDSLYLPGGLTDEQVLAKYHEFRVYSRFTPEELSEACREFAQHIRPAIDLGTRERKRFCDENAVIVYKKLMEQYYPGYQFLTDQHRESIQSLMKNTSLASEKTREIWAEHPSYRNFHLPEKTSRTKDKFVLTVTKKMEEAMRDEYDETKNNEQKRLSV